MAVEKVLYYLGKYAAKSYIKLAFRRNIVNEDTMPAGAKIIAVNHPTTSDPFIISSMLTGQTKVIIHETLFKIPLFGRYLRLSGHIPVTPGKGHKAFEAALETLRKGKNIAVFIEGGLSPRGGGFHTPRTGAARLALTTGAPVIPVGVSVREKDLFIMNTKIKDKEAQAVWLKCGPYAITTGKPLRFKGDVNDRTLVRSITAEIMKNVQSLTHASAARIMEKETAPSYVPGRFALPQHVFRISLLLRSFLTFILPHTKT